MSTKRTSKRSRDDDYKELAKKIKKVDPLILLQSIDLIVKGRIEEIRSEVKSELKALSQIGNRLGEALDGSRKRAPQRRIISEDDEDDEDDPSYEELRDTDDYAELAEELDALSHQRNPTVKKILDSDIELGEKLTALELFDILENGNLEGTQEFLQVRDTLNRKIGNSKISLDGHPEIAELLVRRQPTLEKILSAPIDVNDKAVAIELYELLLKCDSHSSTEYLHLRDMINHKIRETGRVPVTGEQEVLEWLAENKRSYRERIFSCSDYPVDVKAVALLKIQELEKHRDTSDSDYLKTQHWLDNFFRLPYGRYANLPVNARSPKGKIKKHLVSVHSNIKENVYIQKEATDEIMDFVSQTIRSPEGSAQALVFLGPPGCGKSLFAEKVLGPALNRPVEIINLNGVKDPEVIKGHGYTYIGSEPGVLTKAIQKARVMNPIIFIDEPDKCHPDVIATLIDITDLTKDNYHDNFFSGLPLPKKNVLLIFSVNSLEFVNNVMRGRLKVIHFSPYTTEQKVDIATRFMIPAVWREMDVKTPFCTFSPEIIRYIIEKTPKEEGVRDLKKWLKHIIGRINTAILSDFNKELVDLEKKKSPIEVDVDVVARLLLKKGAIQGEKMKSELLGMIYS